MSDRDQAQSPELLRHRLELGSERAADAIVRQAAGGHDGRLVVFDDVPGSVDALLEIFPELTSSRQAIEEAWQRARLATSLDPTAGVLDVRIGLAPIANRWHAVEVWGNAATTIGEDEGEVDPVAALDRVKRVYEGRHASPSDEDRT
jgi:hypothetical protein